MVSNRSRALWQNGIPLNEAWRIFAEPGELKRFDQPIDYKAIRSGVAGDKSNPSIISGVFQTISSIVAANGQKRGLEEGLKEELLDSLFNGDLIATAYRERPSTSASPIVLTAGDFEYADADWENARLFVNGKTYGRVRIIDEYQVGESELPKPRRGRPGSRAAIDATIDALIDRGIDLCASHRSYACKLIRDEIGVTEIPGNGLSDINLSKRIVVKCGIKAIRK